MASKITVAELLVDIGVDAKDANKATNKLDKNLAKTVKTASALGSGLASLGKKLAVFGAAVAAAATGVFAFVSNVATMGDEITKTAKKIGSGVEELQRLRFAADRSGADVAKMDLAIKNLSKNMEDALNGSAIPFREALDALGLSLEEVQGLTVEQRLGVFGDALKGVEDKAQRTALAMNLLGSRAGPELVPLLLEGSKGIRELGDKAEELGLVMDETATVKAEVFVDVVTNLKAVLTGLKNTIGVELLPVMIENIEKFTEWTLANKSLLKQKVAAFFGKIIKVAEKLLPIFKSMGKAVVFLVENFDSLIAILAGAQLASALSAAGVGLQGLGVAAGAALGPLGLILGTLIAITPAAIKAAKAVTDSRLSKLEREAGFTPTTAEEVEVGQESPAIVAAGQQVAADAAQIAKIQRVTGLESSTSIDKLKGRMAANLKKIAALQAREAQAGVEAKAAAALDALPLKPFGPFLPKRGETAITPLTEPKAGKAAAGKEAPVSAVTMQDLINRVIGGGDLTDLVRATPSVAEIEPTIAIDITNNNVNVKVEQTIRGTADPKMTADIATKKIEAFFNGVLRQTGQQLAGNRVI